MSLPGWLTSNREELERVSRAQARTTGYGGDRLLCRLLGKYLAFVDTRDRMIGPRLALDGFWEPWVTLAIARHVQPGMFCLDVGACFGYYSILMADGAGDAGHLLACEPNPSVAGYLTENLKLNGFYAGEVAQCVVCDRSGETDFNVREDDVGVSSLWLDRSPTTHTIRARMATIDELCADWPRVDFIKIDAERADALVWDGMRETLRHHAGCVVALELHLLPDTWELLSRIQRGGYALRHVAYDGSVVETTIDDILEHPDEHWMLWLQRSGQ